MERCVSDCAVFQEGYSHFLLEARGRRLFAAIVFAERTEDRTTEE